MWFLDRLKEKSTWAGLVGYLVTFLSSQGILIPAEWQPLISEFGFLATSSLLIMLKEKKS